MRGQRGLHLRVAVARRIIPARAGPTLFPAWSCRHLAGSSPLVRGQRRFRLVGHAQGRIIPARAGPTPSAPWWPRCRADHPRSCGANVYPSVYGSGLYGSSPLVRGQPRSGYCRDSSVRIIPARAGPTFRIVRLGLGATDHPRSCGANGMVPVPRITSYGSSPLVRGQHERVRAARRETADHPRSCGANATGSPDYTEGDGSSPLVRGQRDQDPEHPYHLRIIPARAGPTTRCRTSRESHTDHPRSCGANGFVSPSANDDPGSSPLVRGQRPRPRLRHLPRRIIPARAGPTAPGRGSLILTSDHPRSCGANGSRRQS